MVTLHENGKTYKIELRGAYAHIRSEKAFREMIENAISRYEHMTNPAWQAYGKALRNKSLREVISIFGLANRVTMK